MEINALKIKIASPEEILSWSYGEVLKAETINYRSQRPEKNGLFSERIFGPTKDYECYCGKYKRVRYKDIVCDRCGVEVTRASVRRERMGHIKLATPVAHIWLLRTIPSKIGLFLNTPLQKLEKVIYYAAYIVTNVNEENKKAAFGELERELRSKKKGSSKGGKDDLESAASDVRDIILSLKPGKILNETEYFNLAKRFGSVFEAGSGAEAVKKILESIDLKKETVKIEKEIENAKDISRERYLLYRLKLVNSFIKNKTRPEWMIMTILPVLPPDLRPMVALDGGRYATSDLNDLYRRVINRNNRLKKLMELKAPEIIITNEKRMLQESVDALIDNTARFGNQPQLSSQRRPLRSLADMLKGKQGRFRQNLLGKRVDYSGRSVIAVGPDLRLNECGLPKKMALEIFKPFVINKIIERGLAHNIRNANHLIENASPEIWEILEEVIAGKKVLLNRAPTLHRLGIQAFKPILIEDLCIRIPPMVCSAFNADFDGDQMAVHLPLTEEAQKEASELMLASGNILKPATGEPVITPSQDIVLGCYYLTKIIEEDNVKEGEEKIFIDIDEAMMAYEFGYIKINEYIKVSRLKSDGSKNEKLTKTSVGRLIFNDVLPKDFKFVNKVMVKKELQKLITELIEKYKLGDIWEILDEIKKLGFYWATISGISWGMDDLNIPAEKPKLLAEAEKEIVKIKSQYGDGLLTDSETRIKTIEIWEKTIATVGKQVAISFNKRSPVFSIIESGARGSWSQPIQMAGMKGLVQSPKGEIIELPVKASYKEGLSVLEFFINTHGARKGLIDTALKTASAGYLTRRLVDVSQDLVIREKDCKTKESIEVLRIDGDAFGYNLGQRIVSRTAAEDIKDGKKVIAKAGEIIDRETAETINKSGIQSVKLRSPITCKTLYGICSKCYGSDLGRNESIKLGEAVGVIAAQSIGEPGTQLTLRTFHKGGVAGVDITHGLPRVQELFEARIPKGRAYLAESEGIIEEIEDEGNLKVIKLKVLKPGKTTKGVKKAKEKLIEYSIPRANAIFVKVGQTVEKGEQLCEGSVELKELFNLKGREAVERYITNEVQKIYVSKGTNINDKHIEIVIKKMFSRVMIKEPGGTDFVIGEVVEKSKFLETNRDAKRKNKEPARAKQLLMGITKTALSTESFLSSASFQETARVLVLAASEGRIDRLRGLKENVIIGRLIPAGTGLRNDLTNGREND
ncbi:DNA-directed RNA polymerase subunit beta' [Candidatus Wolfebacteria bacterium]|uniref:DNA-directed RNA polymerase subunit beta' n=1 Tax=Candidatus Wolfebacteria bacterium CG_4_10_14_0_2_um_filter_39_18 TaxID=1975061 RepID=A0A2M7TFR8_9BACT|nr:DNA-directed RNA polymerase subunit beta' [Candidatus Wolfebacteria bacterium]PIZ44766.1 MAG: DNA-directed RNA polymerase subunit beta' [Candidatus Wolfebacteria bacterium CG_4_10_14_0_2_um_filter_39_18]